MLVHRYSIAAVMIFLLTTGRSILCSAQPPYDVALFEKVKTVGFDTFEICVADPFDFPVEKVEVTFVVLIDQGQTTTDTPHLEPLQEVSEMEPVETAILHLNPPPDFRHDLSERNPKLEKPLRHRNLVDASATVLVDCLRCRLDDTPQRLVQLGGITFGDRTAARRDDLSCRLLGKLEYPWVRCVEDELGLQMGQEPSDGTSLGLGETDGDGSFLSHRRQ